MIEIDPGGSEVLSRSNPTRLRFFQRRIFRTSISWRSFQPPGEIFRFRRNNKCNHPRSPFPTPQGEPIFYKTTWNCFINNSATASPLPPPLNSHTPSIGVIQ